MSHTANVGSCRFVEVINGWSEEASAQARDRTSLFLPSPPGPGPRPHARGMCVSVGSPQGRHDHVWCQTCRPTAIALVFTFIGGPVLLAEACACCKDGDTKECCNKMRDKGAAPKGDQKPAAPEHER